MGKASNRVFGGVAIMLFSLFFSAQAFAIKPANVAIIVDRNDQRAQNAVDMLYEQTWVMLDGEFDVRFTTPRLAKVDELYQDDDVDLVVVMGSVGLHAIESRAHYEKPTFVINAKGSVANANGNNLIVMDDKQEKSVTKETFIKQLVVALREKLRALN
jgi:hypothetical protein